MSSVGKKLHTVQEIELSCAGIQAEANNVHMVEDLYDSVSEDDNYVLTLEERETIHIVKAMQYTKRMSTHMVLNDTLVRSLN